MTDQLIAPLDLTSRPGLADLVECLRRCTRRPGDPATIAQRVADLLALHNPRVGLLTAEEQAGSPDDYTRHTLHAEPSFSVSAVVWRPGQLTEIHDHLVWCTFLILQGTETETLYDIDGDHLVELGELHRPTGSVSGAAPPDDIHRVCNTGDTTAITLHVYGADLSTGSSVRRTYELRDR